MDNPKILHSYINSLVITYPSIKEIWLFGSRANNTFRADSDWDLLVFADEVTFKALQSRINYYNENVDLLINYNGDDFISPWGDPPKRGSLTTWEWKKLTEIEAVYTEVKCIDDIETSREFNANFCYMKLASKRAERVWPLIKRGEYGI